MKKLYPDECPAFEVLSKGGGLGGGFPTGHHFEGFLLSGGEFFPIRAHDDRHHDSNGYPFGIDEVRPLTRAARQMLKLVSP